MTDPDTPRPSADEIRALVDDVRREIDDDMYRYDAWAKKRFDALCAAVESLLEDRELLDAVQRRGLAVGPQGDGTWTVVGPDEDLTAEDHAPW